MNSIGKGRIADFIVYMKENYICEAVYSMENFLKTRIWVLYNRIESGR